MAQQAMILMMMLSLWTTFSMFPRMVNGEGEIAVFWGQNDEDGTLSLTCDSGLYKKVVISFLNEFGGGKIPKTNLKPSHCGGDCTNLEAEIKHCQAKGVKVLLSLGGPSSDYSLSSTNEAKSIASYIFNYFLDNKKGPFGNVALDGVDFHIQAGPTDPTTVWADLATQLKQYKSSVALSASTQSATPDPYLDAAIKTGLFDHLFIQFNPDQFEESWTSWTTLVEAFDTTVYLRLSANTETPATEGVYISPIDLILNVLPIVKESAKYGGVAIWDRGLDIQAQYSYQISTYVPSSILLRLAAALSETISAAVRRYIPLKNNIIIQYL